MQSKLVPLRIPPGWMVNFNQFTEANPDAFKNDDYEYKWEFNEDILQFDHIKNNRTVDLGWYPEFNPKGKYKIVLINSSDPDWQNPIYKFLSRDINEIIEKIEYVLEEVSNGRI
ncbi:hypothetical protein [Paenibacillus prosopidis]|uniref:Uncharacterized protein n=1 Tax=Paenibacillus prosopidis TaxID=630520 RepID=A0A368VKX6_9BACL|nr:hypothetical protein [Paenibacillus prosopidis]RCW40297.1 hypothetical protein DFP97_1388 [Paenibacillus prosopidis]